MGWHWIDKVAAVPAAPAQTRTLMISAGHDHRAPGVVANGFTEAELCLEFRDDLSTRLRERGIRHLKDGEPGENLPLREAVRIAATCDLAVEFHCNGAANRGATGVETLSHARDFPLAGRLCTVMSQTQGLANRGAKPENSGQHHRLAFVSTGGGIIAELFFLTNPADLAAYLDRREALLEAMADALADAARVPT